MKNAVLVAMVVSLMLAAQSWGVSKGKTLEWQTPQGTVVFKGDSHAGKGLKCNECHTKIFKMKKGSAKMEMADINKGKFCGVCHNGKTAFNTSDEKNCVRCHSK